MVAWNNHRGYHEPGNQNSILIKCVLIGYMRGIAETKQREKER